MYVSKGVRWRAYMLTLANIFRTSMAIWCICRACMRFTTLVYAIYGWNDVICGAVVYGFLYTICLWTLQRPCAYHKPFIYSILHTHTRLDGKGENINYVLSCEQRAFRIRACVCVCVRRLLKYGFHFRI